MTASSRERSFLTKETFHGESHHVSRDAVQDAPTPERTNTWVPIPHHRLLEIAKATIEQQGYTVTNEAHGLWGEGARYFGLLELADQNPSMDYSLVFGLRNSHDKSFPASFALGSQVLVCDNLSFIGEVVLNRRCTRFISLSLVICRVSSRRRLDDSQR